jgi:hypothetical protein
VHTTNGIRILKNFVFGICKAKEDYNIGNKRQLNRRDRNSPEVSHINEQLMNTSPKGKGKQSQIIIEDIPVEKRRNSLSQIRSRLEGTHPLFEFHLERNPTVKDSKVEKTPTSPSAPPFKLILENVVDYFEKRTK